MKTEIQKLITDLNEKGKTYSKIVTTLVTLDHAANVKEAEGFLKEAGIEKRVSNKGLTDRMYDFIAESERTKEELEAWIKEHGTANTLRWITSHQKVRELVNRVRKATQENTVEKPEAKTEPKAEPKPAPKKRTPKPEVKTES